MILKHCHFILKREKKLNKNTKKRAGKGIYVIKQNQ